MRATRTKTLDFEPLELKKYWQLSAFLSLMVHCVGLTAVVDIVKMSRNMLVLIDFSAFQATVDPRVLKFSGSNIR